MPRGESGSSPRKRAAATDLHERLSKDELIKRLKVSGDNILKSTLVWEVHLYRHLVESIEMGWGFTTLFSYIIWLQRELCFRVVKRRCAP